MLNERSDVDILLFPVKLCALALAMLSSACGYRAQHAVTEATPLCVRAAPAKVPDLELVEAVLDGTRNELSVHDALGSSYPCLVVEVLRVDEAPTGIMAPAAGETQPFARGTAVAVTARAWVEEVAGGAASRDTGDVRRTARAGAASGAVAESARHGAALRAAGELTGRAVAARALGFPEPSDEAP
ncbi:MAG: hypothetical protein ACOY0T_40065 [Myxococcota bacterium]